MMNRWHFGIAASRCPMKDRAGGFAAILFVESGRARGVPREAERELILKALARTRWNRKRAAQELQISYKSLLYKLKQIGLPGYGRRIKKCRRKKVTLRRFELAVAIVLLAFADSGEARRATSAYESRPSQAPHPGDCNANLEIRPRMIRTIMIGAAGCSRYQRLA